MIIDKLNPVIFESGFLEIRWYGILYLLGFITTYFYLRLITKKNLIMNMNVEDVDCYLIGMITSLVLGARLFHVFVFNPVYYISRPIEILMIWKGGLSFHGALILISIWTYYYCKKKQIIFFQLTDYLIFPAAIFLALGRLGNYIIGDVMGRISSISFGNGLNLTGTETNVLPLQIYDGIKNILVFGILMLIKTLQVQVFRKSMPGILTAAFLIGYGSLGFFIEFLKESTIIFLGLSMGQILSFSFLIFGIYFLKVILKTRRSLKSND